MPTVRDLSGNGSFVDTTNVLIAAVDPNTALLTTITSQLASELTVDKMAEVLETLEVANRNATETNFHLAELTDEEYEDDNNS